MLPKTADALAIVLLTIGKQQQKIFLFVLNKQHKNTPFLLFYICLGKADVSAEVAIKSIEAYG